VRVPQLLALIRDATDRGIEAKVTPRPQTLELELSIEGRLYCVGSNQIRAHYCDPPVGEVRNGWVHQTLTLEELRRQRSVETQLVVERFAADVRRAQEGSAAGA
jgi:hypothetical protein